MASKSTFGEINKEYFNTHADTAFKEEWIQRIMQQISENLQSHIDWIGVKRTTVTEGTASQDAPVRMLDYACGNGMASRVLKHFSVQLAKILKLIVMIQALFPYVSEVRGIDVSDRLVEQYNKSARSHGVPESQMFAIEGDLAVPLTEASHPSLGSSDFFQFDLIVISMALHHIDVPKELIERLVERLNDGGVVVIVDFTLDQEGCQTQQSSKESHSLQGDKEHPAAHTVMHDGFSKEDMDTMLRCAGCNETDYLVLDEPTKVPAKIGGKKQLFFARGKK